jgi:hypothetical protein
VNTINDADRIICPIPIILRIQRHNLIVKMAVRLVLAIRGRPSKAGAPDRALGVGALGVVGHGYLFEVLGSSNSTIFKYGRFFT